MTMKHLTNSPSASELSDWVRDARQRTQDLVSDLSDGNIMGAKLDIGNPVLWEIGHAAWFQEKWVLRHVLGQPPIREDADALWDSMAIAHDTRWDLPLPTRQETLDYLANVCDAVLDALGRPEPTPDLLYHARYAVHHEDMHNEAFTYTRQTHEYTPPSMHHAAEPVPDDGGSCEGDVTVPGGEFRLGAEAQGQFVFDNEKWAHEVRLEPFAIARAPVTQVEFAAFCDDGGGREPRRPRMRCTGARAGGAYGNGECSTDGCRWGRAGSRTYRLFTSTGTRRTRTAGGPAAGCRRKPSGRLPLFQPATRVPSGRANGSFLGGTMRRIDVRPISTVSHSDVSTSVHVPREIAFSDADK